MYTTLVGIDYTVVIFVSPMQVHAMEGMVLSFQVGIVEVKAVDYQMMCLTQPQRIIAVLEEKLPQLASAKCDHLSTEIKVHIHCI